MQSQSLVWVGLPVNSPQNNNTTMFPILPRACPLLALLCLLAPLTAIDITYHRSSSSMNQRSTFAIHWASGGSVISANIQPLSSPNPDYKVLLFLANNYHPTHSPSQEHALQGFAQYNSDPLHVGGEWRVEIIPLTPSSESFLFLADIMVDGVSIGKFTDIARYQRVLPFYSAKRAAKDIKVALPSALSGATVELYGPFDSITFPGGTPLATISGIDYSFQATEQKYYYILVSLSDSLMAKDEYYKVVYQTDRYKCPVEAQYIDRNGGFMGCEHKLPSPQLPCIDFDYERIACTRCMNRYIATDYGLCEWDTSCPEGHFSLLGSCYPIIPKCVSFEFYGGQCYGCEDKYTLERDDNNLQVCMKVVEETVQCGEGQYQVGQECFNEVANCADLERSTGTCKNCKFGHTLADNACVEDENPCPTGYYWRDNACLFIDENCLFEREGKCEKCVRGYKLTGEMCQKITCASNEYVNQEGECVKASPTCKTSDPLYGQCLTCYEGEILRKGKCVRTIPSTSNGVIIIEEEQPCGEREFLKDGICHPVSDKCFTFNEENGRCKSCKQPQKYYLTSYGTCLLKSQACGYRKYWSKEGCKDVSILCETYDPANGRCFTCRDGSVEHGGKCVFDMECGERQYHNEQGLCEDVDETCVDFVPSNGRCMSCIADHEWNEGGVCCWAKNYRDDEQCIRFIEKGCEKVIWQGNLPYCQMCKSGSPPREVFGKCD